MTTSVLRNAFLPFRPSLVCQLPFCDWIPSVLPTVQYVSGGAKNC